MTKSHSSMDPDGTNHIFYEIHFPEIETGTFAGRKEPELCNDIEPVIKPRKISKIDSKIAVPDKSIFD